MIGDYFDLCQNGEPTRRVIQITDEFEHGSIKRCCLVTEFKEKIYYADLDNEVEFVIGNIYK